MRPLEKLPVQRGRNGFYSENNISRHPFSVATFVTQVCIWGLAFLFIPSPLSTQPVQVRAFSIPPSQIRSVGRKIQHYYDGKSIGHPRPPRISSNINVKMIVHGNSMLCWRNKPGDKFECSNHNLINTNTQFYSSASSNFFTLIPSAFMSRLYMDSRTTDMETENLFTMTARDNRREKNDISLVIHEESSSASFRVGYTTTSDLNANVADDHHTNTNIDDTFESLDTSSFSEAKLAANTNNTISNGCSSTTDEYKLTQEDSPDTDLPVPTANGGYSHTRSSKAKISAANKGKVPWNKGRNRSPEERERISQGVRARNRERFLQKLAGMGMTEEEYESKKAEETRLKKEEKATRKTPNGGYSPTKETREKISKILREKYKNGEIQRPIKKGKTGTRVGIKHSAETKEKISKSLKARWSEDPEYSKNIKTKVKATNNSTGVRERISNTLKKKWEDPEFRSYMMEKMATRKSPADQTRSEDYRKKISESMKRKWAEPGYRAKAVGGMALARGDENRRHVATVKSKKSGKNKVSRKKKTTKKNITSSSDPKPVIVDQKSPSTVLSSSMGKKKKKKRKKKNTKSSNISAAVKEKNTITKDRPLLVLGSGADSANDQMRVSKMRDERRDLYDLLYGEEDRASERALIENDRFEGGNEYDAGESTKNDHAIMTDNGIDDLFEDEDDDFNLEDFDPYGLDELEQNRS